MVAAVDRIGMRDMCFKLTVLALLFGVVDAGFDLGGGAIAGESENTHEVHSHSGGENGSPTDDDTQSDHFCHCSSHAPALNFDTETIAPPSRSTQTSVAIESYHSVAVPPPVPPPNV